MGYKFEYTSEVDTDFDIGWSEENVNFADVRVGNGADVETIVRAFNTFLKVSGFDWLEDGQIQFVSKSNNVVNMDDERQAELDLDGC